MNTSTQAEQAGRRADNSDWMDRAVRVGLVSYGVVHLVLAWLTLQLVIGSGGGSASNKGALQELAQNNIGLFFLYVAGVGFLALVAWQALEAIWGHRDEDGGKRVLKRSISGGKVVLYGYLAFSCFKTAIGSSSSGGGTEGMTAQVMQLPAGPVIVGLIGVGVLVTAGFLVYRGWKEKFRSKLDAQGKTGKDGKAYVLAGKIGYIAKGVALAVIGLLFLYAAFSQDAQKSGGLDQALHKVLQQPLGGPVLVVIAIGFACYGVFCFAWARHLDR